MPRKTIFEEVKQDISDNDSYLDQGLDPNNENFSEDWDNLMNRS